MPSSMYPSLLQERKLWRKGYTCIAGVDEVGRGAWAGPMVVGAVVFPRDGKQISGVRDSKLLTPRAREHLFNLICRSALAWAVGIVSHTVIDRRGIVPAHRIATRQALAQLSLKPDFILTDTFSLLWRVPTQPIRDGDGRVYSIAAASIIAKVWRDRLMHTMHAQYPLYRFDLHKGYGTRLHERALQRYGMSPVHRASFVPPRCLARQRGVY